MQTILKSSSLLVQKSCPPPHDSMYVYTNVLNENVTGIRQWDTSRNYKQSAEHTNVHIMLQHAKLYYFLVHIKLV